MPDYRAFLFGSDGHVFQAVALDAPDDTAAIAAAKQLVDGHDVELWQLDRKVAKLEQGRSSMNIERALREAS
jgi:hypothetical protein